MTKAGKLNRFERSQLEQHPFLGFELISRMQNWQETSMMIAQHHEREDGLGYPNQLRGEDICKGAKIIAILDAFFAMIKPRADRPRRRSIMRAVAEINACVGTQFSPFWVNHFNAAIKSDMKEGLLLQIAMEEPSSKDAIQN